MLEKRWEEGPEKEALAADRVRVRDELVAAVKENCKEEAAEKCAKRYELEAYLAAKSFKEYLQDCEMIKVAIPAFSTAPPYSEFQHVKERLAKGQSTKENDGPAQGTELSVREAAKAVLVLRNALEKPSDSIDAEESIDCETKEHNSNLKTPVTRRISSKIGSKSSSSKNQEGLPLRTHSFPKKASHVTSPIDSSPTAKSGSSSQQQGAVLVVKLEKKTSPSSNLNISSQQNSLGSGRRSSFSMEQQQVISQTDPSRFCTCSKSFCLKMYCGCFAANAYCESSCKCTGCKNTVANDKQRQNAINKTLLRHPDAFTPKTKKVVFCTCKRSKCLKMYCDCFAGNSVCNSRCRCTECSNYEGSSALKEIRTVVPTAKRKSPMSKDGGDSICPPAKKPSPASISSSSTSSTTSYRLKHIQSSPLKEELAESLPKKKVTVNI